ncbi:hypothetical protein [Azospirillum argentinense]|uniref:hypothetical protein n=1 Tax=Azospirillum argentinense TaxID=2970906 RepID=UPI0032E04597
MSLLGQPVPEPVEVGSLPLSHAINHIVGAVTFLLERPAGAKHLVLAADRGGWRVRVGAFGADAMPATEYPAGVVNNGTGAYYLPAGSAVTIPAPGLVTVRGYAADSVLTYYWL